MKNLLLISSILMSAISLCFSQSTTRENSSSNSTIYFKVNSFGSSTIAERTLLNEDLSFNLSNKEYIINYLNVSLESDTIESLIGDFYVLTREQYNEMDELKKIELNNFIESLYPYIDSLEQIHYPKQLGYFLPLNEIEVFRRIISTN